MKFETKANKALTFLLAVIMILPLLSAASINVNAETKYAGSAQLYYLDQGDEKYISIPSGLLKEYQIKLDKSYNSVRYSVDGESVTVDNSGMVRPRTSETIVIGAQSGTAGNRLTYTPGLSVVTVYADNDVFNYEITVVSYAEYYATEVMRNYIDKNITGSMSGYEKLTKICEFICRYDYNVSYQSIISVIVTGEGGDCWSSADGIVTMAEMAGLKARARSDEYVSIFRGGHINAVVMADGKYYIAEAGYSGKAPRSHSISEYSAPFRYSKLPDGTIEIKEYLGFDRKVNIPKSIDGYTVSRLGGQCFYLPNAYMSAGEKITSVAIPDTVTTIGVSAFYNCRDIKEIYIPASVSAIEMSAFSGCESLTLTIDEKSPYFYSDKQNGVLFSADKKTIINAYNLQTDSYIIPNGVTKIADSAFYNCSLSDIYFPDTLEDIGYRAFTYCNFYGRELVLPKSVSGIGYGAFYSTGIKSITILNPACTINNTREEDLYLQEDGKTLGEGDNIYLYGFKNSTLEDYAKQYGVKTIYWTNMQTGEVTPEEKTYYSFFPITNDSVPVPNLDSAAAWAHESIKSAVRKGFVPQDLQSKYTDVITREEFCRMAVRFAEYKLGKGIDAILAEKGLARNPNAFTDSGDPDILAAFALGITGGTGNNQFTPNGQFTREQAAAMIMNTCRVIGMDTVNPPASGFTDMASVSSWAADGVNFCYANQIMGGTSAASPVFSPKGMYTRQESIATFDRIK